VTRSSFLKDRKEPEKCSVWSQKGRSKAKSPWWGRFGTLQRGTSWRGGGEAEQSSGPGHGELGLGDEEPEVCFKGKGKPWESSLGAGGYPTSGGRGRRNGRVCALGAELSEEQRRGF
jgi:hypothetical protein